MASVVSTLMLVGAMLFVSCATTTAPRSRASGEKTGVPAWDDASMSSVIRSETNAEDDRKVDWRKYRAIPHHVRPNDTTDDTPAGMSRDRMLLGIVDYLGVPYKYGGGTRKGIDCSGFTSLMYASGASVELPRSTVEQYIVGIPVDDGKLKFGDLVFFNTTGRSPSHVGIFLEDELFVHASVTDGVTISSLESTYYRKRYIGARRVMP
jgi:cell wall-associated NlpC family hydrolase